MNIFNTGLDDNNKGTSVIHLLLENDIVPSDGRALSHWFKASEPSIYTGLAY